MAEKINRVRCWVRAFIPQKIVKSNGTEYTRKLSGGPYAGETVIPGPSFTPPLPTVPNFFLTDNRNFDPNPSAGSRMHIEAIVDVNSGNVAAPSASGGKSNPRCDLSVGFDELAGVVVKQATGDASRLKLDQVRVTPFSDGAAAFWFRLPGAASNPLVPGASVIGDIDWVINVALEIDAGRETGRAKISGLVDPFPAHEMYVAVNDRPAITVYQLPPLPDTDPWNLVGLPNRPIAPGGTGTTPIVISLGANWDGVWKSTDAGSRFQISLMGETASLTERNAAGATLTRSGSLVYDKGQYRFERINNDIPLLQFLDFKATTQQAIVASNPKPSFLTFFMDGGMLKARWSGLSVTLKPDGSVNQIFQPGSKPPRDFTFIKVA